MSSRLAIPLATAALLLALPVTEAMASGSIAAHAVAITDSATTAPAHAAVARPATVTIRSTSFGRILTDGRGFALYLFTRDGRGPSRCYRACARVWPPLLTRGPPTAAGDARSGLLGTTRRAGGRRQVTYRGQPLYHFVGDASPRQVLCQGAPEFGGVWWVVSPRGYAIH